MLWTELSTLARRSFELYLTEFQDESPGSNLRRSADPRPEGDAVAVPFEDAVTGAKYEVLVHPDGSVNGTRQVA